MDLSIIIPVYNNAATLAELVRRIDAALEGRGLAHEIILVNDGSRDGSWPLIGELCRARTHVVGVNFTRNFGQHAGIKAGLAYARGGKIVLMDADLEDEPERIPAMLEAMTDDVDCVYTVVGANRRRWTSQVFHAFAGRFTRSEAPAGVGTMRLFSRRFRDALMKFPERRPVWGPIMHALGFRHKVISLPDTGPRSRSSYNLAKRARLAMDFMIANTSAPFSVIFFVAFALFAISIGYALVILAQYLFFDATAPSGVALIAFLIAVLFGFNFLFLAVMGLYVHRVMVETLGRPVFVVSEALNAARDILTDREEVRT